MNKQQIPNQLTMFRVVLIPVFLWVLFSTQLPNHRYLAIAIFIIASVTDFFDGYLARKWHVVSNFGKFMDPLADKLLVMAAMVALVEMGDLPSWVVILILARELAITGFRTLAVEANIVLAASFWGKLKTVTQMAMIVMVLLQLENSMMILVTDILIYASAILTVVSGADYFIKNKEVFGTAKQ
ncbi:MAG: CDP-diacylglycerol--glycerol-3-phosphate 3-phosphatidyltransferase [Bacillota bacterium]